MVASVARWVYRLLLFGTKRGCPTGERHGTRTWLIHMWDTVRSTVLKMQRLTSRAEPDASLLGARWRGPILRVSPLRSHPGHGFNAKRTRLNRRSRGCAITVARDSPKHSMKASREEIFEERRVNCVLKFKNDIKRFRLLLFLPLWIISKCKFSSKLL